jgi:hypothetical protein
MRSKVFTKKIVGYQQLHAIDSLSTQSGNYRQFRNLKPARSGVDHDQSHKVDLQVIFALKIVWTNEVGT